MQTGIVTAGYAANITTRDKPVSKRMDNRRENLRALAKARGGTNALARELGYRSASYLSQMIGAKHSRPVTEDTARDIETKLGLAEGSLDWPPETGRPSVALPASVAAPATHTVLTIGEATRDAQIVQMFAAVWSEDQVALPVLKFGQIAAYAISEAAQTGSVPTPDSLRRLVTLLK